MRLRHLLRLEERTRANAALCGVPLDRWQALTRRQRKNRTQRAKQQLLAAQRRRGGTRG